MADFQYLRQAVKPPLMARAQYIGDDGKYEIWRLLRVTCPFCRTFRSFIFQSPRPVSQLSVSTLVFNLLYSSYLSNSDFLEKESQLTLDLYGQTLQPLLNFTTPPLST